MATKITIVNDDDDDDRPEQPDAPDGTVAKRSLPQVRYMEARAIELAARGATYRQIADELGYGSTDSAMKALERGLARYVRPSGDKVARLQHMRIGMGIRKVFEILDQEEYLHTPGGKPLVNPVTGEYVRDSRRWVDALNTLLGLMEREAKLTGADAPSKKMNMNVPPPTDQVHGWVQDLQQKFSVSGPDDPRVIQGYPEDDEDDGADPVPG